MPDGSWKCEKCNNINYPFRMKCNRQNCGAEKPAESKKSPSSAPDDNDQVCYVIHLDCIPVHCVKLLFSLITYVCFTNSMSNSEMFAKPSPISLSYSLFSFSHLFTVWFLQCMPLIVNYHSVSNH